MRIIIAALFMLLLTGCVHTRTSEEAYAEGNYLESIHLLALDIEKKGPEKFDQETSIKLHNLVINIMVYYETTLANTAKTDFDNHIMIYNQLSEMRERLSNQFYSQELGFFLNKYSAEKLNKVIAKTYYDEGNSITAKDSASFKRKADLYQKGLNAYNYKNIKSLYKINNTKYMQLAAKEYYEQGKIYVKQHSYQAAGEAFQNAVIVYKPLGKYKDSEKLAIYYDKLYRTNEAESSYQEGERLASLASTHSQYRQAAAEYKAAMQVYSRYGEYRDANIKAYYYANKGKVKVFCQPFEYQSILRQVTNGDYILFVYSSSDADIFIDISSSEDFYDRDKSITTESKTKKEKKYNIKTETLQNKLILTTDIRVHGLLNYNNSFTVEETSSKVTYSYSGNVPKGYRNHTEGYLKSRYTLSDEANRQQEDELIKEFSYITKRIEKL